MLQSRLSVKAKIETVDENWHKVRLEGSVVDFAIYEKKSLLDGILPGTSDGTSCCKQVVFLSYCGFSWEILSCQSKSTSFSLSLDL